ncbi:hypothetical protein [Sciscionella marina]|uniref:hypothetical protein n=1 Tax=Sciscionella marina TaxID=508770 RepID=UPI0012F6BC82|nr:hypothetical protein [Sciscionella marina]
MRIGGLLTQFDGPRRDATVVYHRQFRCCTLDTGEISQNDTPLLVIIANETALYPITAESKHDSAIDVS